ncbi:MAG: flagellar hook-associated protein FlgK [Devosia sp.]|nr:flagellar hook-associated protein FlgK [Devosia sp.]
MGLSASLSNALSGMKVGQSSLDIVSRNVANSGTPGYYRQSLSVIDTLGVNSNFVRNGAVTRAFNQSLQQYYTRNTSESGFVNVRANFLDRLQMVLGKPGTAGSLDTAFGSFQTALGALATSPDNYATRAQALASAQVMAATFNNLSNQVQGLRRETESKIASNVSDLNQMLSSLEKVNQRLSDRGIDANSRVSLLDQRDRLIAQVSEVADIRVDYRASDTVALMTRSGVGLLDGKASMFQFESAGALSATALFNSQSGQSGVGKLTLLTPSGLAIDLVQQNVLQSGELAGLIEMRDVTLVQVQHQLDEIAAAMAQAMSTVKTAGTAVTVGAATGFEIDLGAIRNGNDFVLDYAQGGLERSVKVVRVDDTTKLPLDYVDASGQRVIGLDFSGGAGSVATQLQAALGTGFSVSGSGDVLSIVNDGANTTDIVGLTGRTTVTAAQGGGIGLSLFVDAGNIDFTNCLDGRGQKLGFAARISVNSDIVNNSKLLVQYVAGGSLGDAARVNYLADQLETMQFAMGQRATDQQAAFRMSGSVSDLISQTINYQGNSAATAIGASESQALTMEILTQRMDTEYGVDVDEEMARLMELQNAFAANARVISIIQELLDQLLRI